MSSILKSSCCKISITPQCPRKAQIGNSTCDSEDSIPCNWRNIAISLTTNDPVSQDFPRGIGIKNIANRLSDFFRFIPLPVRIKMLATCSSGYLQ